MALITWVKRDGPGRLGAMARPGQQEEVERDLRKAKEEGVDLIVSLLTDEEVKELGVDNEAEVCKRIGIKYRRFPIPDHETPPADQGTMDFLRACLKELRNGKSVIFHCSKGRGRTTLMGASLLVMEGMGAERAIQHVRGRRLIPVPDNKKQTEWVRALADASQPRQRRLLEEEEDYHYGKARKYAAIGILGAVVTAYLVLRRTGKA
jgi:protein-tyrosine phosphatase